VTPSPLVRRRTTTSQRGPASSMRPGSSGHGRQQGSRVRVPGGWGTSCAALWPVLPRVPTRHTQPRGRSRRRGGGAATCCACGGARARWRVSAQLPPGNRHRGPAPARRTTSCRRLPRSHQPRKASRRPGRRPMHPSPLPDAPSVCRGAVRVFTGLFCPPSGGRKMQVPPRPTAGGDW